MSQIKNKINWCLNKAKKELADSGKHRGLVLIKPNKEKAKEFIEKAEHYLEATLLLKEKFSDISATTTFYSIYHSLLAILTKFGYESRNQECTFAAVYSLIENKKINIDKSEMDKIALLSSKDSEDKESVIEIREKYQYGTDLTMREDLYNSTLILAKDILGKTKEIIERDAKEVKDEKEKK